MLVFTSSALAGDFEVVGGLNYNTFDLGVTVDGEVNDDLEFDDALKSGTGFYGGVLYWINDSFAVGAAYETANSSCKMDEFNDSPNAVEFANKLSGPAVTVVYKLNDMFSLEGGIASYSQDLNFTTEISGEDVSGAYFKSSGLAYLVGGKFNYPVKDNISITGNLGYRIANLTVNEELDEGTLESGDPETQEPAEDTTINLSGLRGGVRSEERRVGKECRARWWA